MSFWGWVAIGVIAYLAISLVWMFWAMKNAPEMVEPEDQKLLNDLQNKHES